MIEEKRGIAAALAFISTIFMKELHMVGIALLFICNANADVLHIRTIFCARIQGNQGAPRVHRARAQQQVNKGKKFFARICTNFVCFVKDS